MIGSFAPEDFSTGKWPAEGASGAATITKPIFKYRSFDVKTGERAGQTVKNVTFYCEFFDEDGQSHKAQYDLGNAEYCQIKESADDGADEAEEGPAIANPDPTKQYHLYPDCDFALLMASLVSAGFDSSKLKGGDITVIDGVEVEVYRKPRKEGDKFPLLLIKSVKGKKAAAKGGAVKGAAVKKAVSGASEEVRDKANSFMLEVLSEGPATKAELVKKAMATFKQDEHKAEIVKLLQDASYLSGDDWTYDAESKTVSLA